MEYEQRLALLAAEIRVADGRYQRSTEEAAAAALEAGNKLIEAKSLLKHGEWLPWLRDNVAMSDRTANRYMQLARSGANPPSVADLGIAAAAKGEGAAVIDIATKQARTPQLTKAREIIRPILEANEPINAPKLQKQHGISHVTFDMAVSAERSRMETLAEIAAPIDTSDLPKSSQEKLTALERRLRAQLESEFDGRVREEVKRRLAERDEADTEAVAQANELIMHSHGRSRPPFNPQEYHSLLWALHPDNNDPAKVTAAFVLVRRKKLILCDEGPIHRRSPPLPSVLVRVKRGGRA